MNPPPILIAGGGIAGLALALTCDEIGVPCLVLESVRELAPLGVGINLQPNAVRELYDLGLESRLGQVGIEAKEWAIVTRSGTDIWAEPRGLLAGYRWPQYSVHRGDLQMMLYDEVCARMGAETVQTGHRVIGYRNTADGVIATVDTRDGNTTEIRGTMLIGADGLHSAVRAQMHPDQPDPHWEGAVMWRGATPGPPIRTGASFTLVGSLEQRFVTYPISQVDPVTGLQLQNWIAEVTFDPADGWASQSDWNRRVDVSTILPYFQDWDFDWLDIPSLVRQAPAVWEYPMVDRDPVDRWVDGRVCLIGDAAHVMYPVGSNGASQAIVDARVLGAKLVEHGVAAEALLAFESDLLEDISALVLRNRGQGPVAILGIIDERGGGDDAMSQAEIENYMARYKQAAGFAVEALNAAARTIPT